MFLVDALSLVSVCWGREALRFILFLLRPSVYRFLCRTLGTSILVLGSWVMRQHKTYCSPFCVVWWSLLPTISVAVPAILQFCGKHERVSAVCFVHHFVWFDGCPCLLPQSQCQWSLSSVVSMGVSAVCVVHHSVWLNDDACLLSQPQCPTTHTGCPRECHKCCVLFSLFTVLMDCVVNL